MKALLAALVLVSSVVANAQTSLQYPNKSDWAIGMINMACKTDLNPETVTGVTIERSDEVVYLALNADQQVVASAAATSSWILSKKTCLVRQ